MKTVTKELKEIIKELNTIKELSYDQIKFLMNYPIDKNKKDNMLIFTIIILSVANLVLLYHLGR